MNFGAINCKNAPFVLIIEKLLKRKQRNENKQGIF